MKLIPVSLVALFAVLACVACPGTGGSPTNPVEQDFLDCAHIDISQPVAIGLTLVQDVTKIVEAGADGWETALAQLVLTYGNDALVCALKAAGDAAAAHPPHIEPTRASILASQRAYSQMKKFANGRSVK